jgi:amidase
MSTPDPIFCQHADVHLPGAASGPLAGLQFAAKDVYAVAGVRACYGNPAWLASHDAATETAPVVRRLLAAGATLKGLVITDELALSLTGENAHYGTPPNPRAPDRVPGGSSCGSAAAVASGLVDFALGTDTGGSVRVPASHCGLFGLRPTHGAISTAGVLPLAPSFDTVGWFSRDAALCARVGDVLLPPSAAGVGSNQPNELRVWRGAEALLDPPARSVFRAAADQLAATLGLNLRECDLAAGDPLQWLLSYYVVQGSELLGLHRQFIEAHLESFGRLIQNRLRQILGSNPLQLPAAVAQRQQLTAALSAALADGAWLLLPSAPGAAPLRGQPDDVIEAYTARGISLGALASLSGFPQLSLPLASVNGCPFGISLLAPAQADRALLDVARRFTPRPWPTHSDEAPDA